MGKEKKAFIYDKRTKDFILSLYDKYREGMIKLAFSKLNDWHEAEDAVEEAFINVTRNYEKIIDSEEYEIKKYLVNTVINTSYKILAKNKRNNYSDTDTIEELLPLTDSAEEIAVSEISYDELKNLVDEIINPRYKLILNMKYMGYNNKEIAEELNVKSGTVRVMQLRIRSFIKISKEGARMKRDKNNIEEILSTEDEHLIHRASEVQFNKDMELFDSFMDDSTEIPRLSDFDSHMHNKINEMYRDGRRHRRNKLIFKTLATSVAVILLTFVFYPPLFGKVNAFFFKMMNLTATDKGEYTEFRLEPADNQSIDEFKGYYYPRYIPDGYEIIIKNNMESMGTIIYSNKSEGTSVTYEFSSLNSPQQLDTEDCNKQDIIINNQLGVLYTKKDNSCNMIIFQNEEYKFVVYSEAGVEILKEIAESIKR